jgi:hypothetical protein
MILEQSLVILYLPTNSELLVMTLVFDFINVPQVLRDSITSSNFHDKKKSEKSIRQKILTLKFNHEEPSFKWIHKALFLVVSLVNFIIRTNLLGLVGANNTRRECGLYKWSKVNNGPRISCHGHRKFLFPPSCLFYTPNFSFLPLYK